MGCSSFSNSHFQMGVTLMGFAEHFGLYLPRCHIESTLEPKNALGDYLDGFALEKIFA